MTIVPFTLRRIALGLPEARLDHGLSQRKLAELSGVSATSIRQVERGGRIDPALLVRLGGALIVLDAYRPSFENDVDELLATPARGPWSNGEEAA